VEVVTTYGEAQAALRSRDLRQSLYDEGHRLMDGVIVNLHGEAHVARRRLENRLFRLDTFAWYERERIPATVAAVLAAPIAAGRGDLLPLARRTMMTLSIEVAGVARPEDPAAFERFAALMEDMARAATVTHATGDKGVIVERGDAALATFATEFFEPARRARVEQLARVERGEEDADALPRDVLTTLLRNQDRLELPAATVLREVAYFPWVGSHSTSAQLVHAVHHLFEWIADRPADRARLEADDALRQRFVHESMRLHPASPVARRRALADVTLPSGRVLPAGSDVEIRMEEANRDPAVFGADAATFDPGRARPDGVPAWGLSFGHGTHACLGTELAAGVAPGSADPLFGAVALMAGAVLRAGATPDPEDPPTLDGATSRVVWGRYPVRFARA
jgi:cytochrome P450